MPVIAGAGSDADAEPAKAQHVAASTRSLTYREPLPPLQVHGVSLDLVNLRSETYAQDSRIPEAQFGTPQQDATRRDLTINALFYNLDT